MSNKAKILLVDDEPGMLRYIKTLLEVDDHFVETASTGEEALDRVQKGLIPDLVLLDLLMPGIDGLTLLKFFRANRSTRETPMIVLSSKEEPATKAQAFALGANDYLVKGSIDFHEIRRRAEPFLAPRDLAN